MMERRRIVEQWKRGEAAVLVTLVRIEGSSYRRAGARLLIGAAGEHAGTISGGCLETDVLRRAVWKVREGAAVETYSMRFDDTAEVPFGLGCGGEVDLLLEAAATPEFEALLTALDRTLSGEELRVVTRLPGEGKKLQRVIFDVNQTLVFASDSLTAAEVEAARLAVFAADSGETPGYFLELLKPPQRLVVYGAGEDARPLVEMAALLGWTVVVADGRAQFATRERFAAAQEVIALGPEGRVDLLASDAVVLMTHSYEQDRRLLAATLPHGLRYLGVLGARHRTSVLLSEAAVLAGLPLETACGRLFAPIGLDLGGDGPEAIALAILAQIQAVLAGRGAMPRRLTPGDVAANLEREGTPQMLRECSL